MSNWPRTRDLILFAVGLSGVLALTLTWILGDRSPDPQLILLFTAMMGLPAFLRSDEKDKDVDGR
jgi:hypothetical protein